MALAAKAVPELGLALQTQSDNAAMLQTKGVALKQQGELLEAADIFEALIESAPYPSENYPQLSLCFYEHNMHESGIESFHEALAIAKSPTLITRLCSDLSIIAMKWVYFAHDCLNLGGPEAFERIAIEVPRISEVGLKFDPKKILFGKMRDQILNDIRQVKNIH
jgi:tetratricopeptide (TPR) repeat protein